MPLARRIQSVAESLTLALGARTKALKARGVDVVSFTAGELDFDTPEPIKEAARAALARGDTKYTPVGGTADLKAAIAAKLAADQGLRYAPDEILVSCGAKHSLYNLFQVLLDPGDEVVIPAPYWLSYPEMARLAEAVPVTVETREEEGFKLRSQDLARAIGPRTRIVVLNSPSNPTGAVYSEQDLKALVETLLAWPDVYVISDEIYEKLVYGGARHVSIAEIAPPELRARTIVVNGVSKTYAMTGWRIGYAAGPRDVIDAADRLQSHSSSNPASISQAAAAAALRSGDALYRPMVEELDRRRRVLVDGLKKLPGCSLVEPEGAFYGFLGIGGLVGGLVGGREGLDVTSAQSFADVCLDRAQVAVIPCAAFGAPRHVRLSYSIGIEEIRKGLARLAELVAGIA